MNQNARNETKERRPLIAGLPTREAKHEAERSFIYDGETPATSNAPERLLTETAVAVPGPLPLTTRIRGDFALSLKRASLERQLSGTQPNTIKEILEEALEPWLRSNGYLG